MSSSFVSFWLPCWDSQEIYSAAMANRLHTNLQMPFLLPAWSWLPWKWPGKDGIWRLEVILCYPSPEAYFSLLRISRSKLWEMISLLHHFTFACLHDPDCILSSFSKNHKNCRAPYNYPFAFRSNFYQNTRPWRRLFDLEKDQIPGSSFSEPVFGIFPVLAV